MATLATHNGSAAHRAHNIRDPKVISKEQHIDPNRTYEIWLDEKPRDAYKRLFGAAVAKYNAQQPIASRRIKDYFTEVSRSAKKHPVYEMICGVYGKGQLAEPEQKQILMEYVDGWKKRNPNLELIGAYYHADEEGEPHVHLDYIPVATGYTRGMEVQTGLVKALEQQGFVKLGKETAQIQWQRAENNALESVCKAHGVAVEHPRGENRQHLETELYKAQARVEELQGKALELEELRALHADKGLFGRAKGTVTLPEQEYMDLRTTAEQAVSKNAELKQQCQKLFVQKANQEKQLDYCKRQLAELQKDSDALHKQLASVQTREAQCTQREQLFEQKISEARREGQNAVLNQLAEIQLTSSDGSRSTGLEWFNKQRQNHQPRARRVDDYEH